MYFIDTFNNSGSIPLIIIIFVLIIIIAIVIQGITVKYVYHHHRHCHYHRYQLLLTINYTHGLPPTHQNSDSKMRFTKYQQTIVFRNINYFYDQHKEKKAVLLIHSS